MANPELGIVIESSDSIGYQRNLVPLNGREVEIGGIKVSPHGEISGNGFYLSEYVFLPIGDSKIPPGTLCEAGPFTIMVEPLPQPKKTKT